MTHAAVGHLSGMILLHSILSLFASYINRKRGIKHCEECLAFSTYHHIAVHGRKQKKSAIFSIAMGTMLRQKGFLC